MPFDISGTFSRVYDFETDRTNGIPIMSARVDGEFDGIAQGLTESFCRDGRAAMTGNLRMGNYRLSGLGDGSLASPAISFQSETNSGLYRPAANQLAIVIAGTSRLGVDSTGATVTGAFAVSGGIGGASGAFSGAVSVLDDPYAVGWNGSSAVPTKNAVYDQMELKANLASPALTGVPTAPTAGGGTNTTQIATTAFVTAAIPSLAAYAPLASPTFTGVPAAPTAAPGTNTTQLATCAFVAAGLTLKSDLASPTFTGTPAAPTAAPGTNTTQLASTAFVAAGLALKSDLASPTFTGTPLAPTAAWATNTTQLATCAFVDRFRGIPSSSSGAATPTAAARGTCIKATGAQLFNTGVFSADDIVTVYADQAGTVALTQGAGVTMRLNGTATTGTRTLAGRGFATIYWISGTECVVSGNVT